MRQYYGLDLADAGRTYDLRTAGCLCAQLPSDSRVRRRMSGDGWSEAERLLALVRQSVDVIWWQRTRDGQRNGAKAPALVPSPAQRAKAADDDARYTRAYMDEVADALGIPEDRR